jgi:hypothetical protein
MLVGVPACTQDAMLRQYGGVANHTGNDVRTPGIKKNNPEL